MIAILKREIGSYFTSAIGYVVLSIFYFFSGLFFYNYCLRYQTSELTYVFYNLFLIILFLIPILTMKLFSEDKKHKSDQTYLTAPINISSIVFGKFLSAVVVFAIGIAIFILFAVVISFFTTPAWSVIFCNILGILLLGAALISIGMFISSLTESQAIAAMLGMFVGLVIYMLNSIASLVNISWISNMIYGLSFMSHYYNFTYGIISLSDIVFFLTISGIFIYLTARVLEKRRWG